MDGRTIRHLRQGERLWSLDGRTARVVWLLLVRNFRGRARLSSVFVVDQSGRFSLLDRPKLRWWFRDRRKGLR